MSFDVSQIKLKNVPVPDLEMLEGPVLLTDQTIEERKTKVLSRMKKTGLDSIVVYADMEHGSNFEYLVGFLPRFEEALLVLHSDGTAYLVLGNENLNKASKSRIFANPILASYFSLPDQPMQNNESLKDILMKTQISGKKIGLVGWKKFRSSYENNERLLDLPNYLVKAFEEICGEDNVVNATSIFIGEDGARVTNNINELLHYEYGASLASDGILAATNALKEGVSELEVADKLVRYGQHTNIVTISAFGERFVKANMYPTTKKLALRDTISLTVGYKGGSSSRSSIAVHDRDELPEDIKDYFEKVCAPYFNSIRVWLENVHVGMKGKEIYNLVEDVLPKKDYHWLLCPGHTVADEEWMSSPIYEGSEELIQSGCILQTDIIPKIEGYPGTCVESTCAVVDKETRERIQIEEPLFWQRIQERRNFIINELGINLHEDVIPMCNTLGYLRPYGFSDEAIVCEHEEN